MWPCSSGRDSSPRSVAEGSRSCTRTVPRSRRRLRSSISTKKDPENLTLTLVAEFDATPERVWSVWEDPRKLEQWWGPPGWPATFTRHDFVVGGESRYHMTGPEGEVHRSFWRMHVIDKPVRIEFDNGFVGTDGEPTPE